ncbi:MAG: DNA/RNA non-specific endonuclease [Paludibacteraceae bacterium]|nr:DNA/RNA non-specific endonuclease [Paludibacteraceae bacterium]
MKTTSKIILAAVCVAAVLYEYMQNSQQASAGTPGAGRVAAAAGTNAYYRVDVRGSVPRTQTVQYKAYESCYHNGWRQPVWVGYELTAEEAVATAVDRKGRQFYPDPATPGAPDKSQSFGKFGFDKGHMMPCMDARWSEEAMSSSFSYVNCCPQFPNLNQGIWRRLEEKVNQMAVKYGCMYVSAGPIVPADAPRFGAEPGIAVPSHFFKVLCYERADGWHATAFLFPNAACSGSMFDYTLTVDSLESLTGYDFLYNLPDDLENQVEAAPFRAKYWQ